MKPYNFPQPTSLFKARKGQTHTKMTTENAQELVELVELSTLELPAFAQRLIQYLKRIGRTRIRREYLDPEYSFEHSFNPEYSFGILMQDMALQQFREGHIDEELADCFFETAITRAILSAQEEKEDFFSIWETFIKDFFPLLVREESGGYYRMEPMEFRRFISLMTLIIHDYRVSYE